MQHVLDVEQRINDLSLKAYQDYSEKRKKNPLDKRVANADRAVMTDQYRDELLSKMQAQKQNSMISEFDSMYDAYKELYKPSQLVNNKSEQKGLTHDDDDSLV